ncbi:MAG: hypothetical protein ACTHN5_11315 [Phycisphaerae bacterium]
MIPGIRKPPISQQRKAAALIVAGIADFLQIMLLPALGFGYVLDDAIDFATAILLTAICGFKWQFVLAFMFELIPGFDLLPTWSAVALLIPSSPNTVIVAGPPQPPPRYPVLEGKAVVIPPIQPPRQDELPGTSST